MMGTPWTWMKAVQVAMGNGNRLEIDWRWRNRQRRRAARRAAQHGYLKRVPGKPGADHYVLIRRLPPKETHDGHRNPIC